MKSYEIESTILIYYPIWYWLYSNYYHYYNNYYYCSLWFCW